MGPNRIDSLLLLFSCRTKGLTLLKEKYISAEGGLFALPLIYKVSYSVVKKTVISVIGKKLNGSKNPEIRLFL